MDFKKAFFMGSFSAAAVAGAVLFADKALNRVVKGTLADDTLAGVSKSNYVKKEPEKTIIPDIEIKGQTVAAPVIEPIVAAPVEEPVIEQVAQTVEQPAPELTFEKAEEPAPQPVIEIQEQQITEPLINSIEQALETPEEEPLKPVESFEEMPAASLDFPEQSVPKEEEIEEPAYNPYLSVKPPYEVAPVLPEDQLDDSTVHDFKVPETEKVSEPALQEISDINDFTNVSKFPSAPQFSGAPQFSSTPQFPSSSQFAQAEQEPELMVTPGLPYIAGKLEGEDEPIIQKQPKLETNAPLPQFDFSTQVPQMVAQEDWEIETNVPLESNEVQEVPTTQVEFNAPLFQQDINVPSEPVIEKTTKTQVIGSNTVSDEEDNGAIVAVSHSNPSVNVKNLVSIMAEDNTGLVFEFSNSELRDETTLVNVYSITPDGKAVLPPYEQKDEILKFGKTFITDKQELRSFLAK